jgi:hypothetical protein
MLESVYRQMKHHFKEHRTMACLFEPVEDIEDKSIKSYLTKIYHDYQNAEKKGDIDFFFQSEDEAYDQAREKVNGERTPHIFIEPTQIIALTN